MSEYKYEVDLQSKIVHAERVGIQKGIHKGIQEGVKKVARKMKSRVSRWNK
jgi:hypothetical protein